MPANQQTYPPCGFFFRVQTVDASGNAIAGGAKLDMAFQDAAGLSVEMEAETVAEGGLNTYKHRQRPGAEARFRRAIAAAVPVVQGHDPGRPRQAHPAEDARGAIALPRHLRGSDDPAAMDLLRRMAVEMGSLGIQLHQKRGGD